jgi:hypothetical protein
VFTSHSTFVHHAAKSQKFVYYYLVFVDETSGMASQTSFGSRTSKGNLPALPLLYSYK